MFGKKGLLDFITLIEVVIAILLAVVIILAALLLSDENQLNQFAVSKDVALLIEASQATPRSFVYEYPETLYQSNIRVEDGFVAVEPRMFSDSEIGSFSPTRYHFDLSELTSVEKVLVDGRFFAINKGKDDILFSKGAVIKTIITKREYEDIVVGVYYKNSDDKLIDEFGKILLGDLASSFPIDETPTLRVGLSTVQSGIIYHSDHEETKYLAEKLQSYFKEVPKLNFGVAVGSLEDDSFFVEIGFSPEHKEALSTSGKNIARGVSQTIEQFYKQ